jgi:uncharacterized membrane protein YfcA
MDLQIILMLFSAGIIGGMLSGLVGGASLVTFPALLAIGLPPVTAAASNQVAALPSNFAAAFIDRAQFPRIDRSFAILVVTSVIGALAGAFLLLSTPGRVFEILVPLLLGFATILFAVSPQISRWLRARALAAGRASPRTSASSVPMLFPISVYGGYFGAGVGVLALAALSVATDGDYRAANMTKNIVLGLNTFAASAVLALQSAVSWPPTLIMMAGAVIGGLLGGQLARVVPNAVMRVFVVAVGALLTAVFAWRYWF